MKQRLLQTNFSSGELDPLMALRVDTGAYVNGASKIRNGLIYSTGGVARRNGTLDKAALPALCRLVPFDFADDERYIFAFSAGRLDVYDTDGALVQTLSGGSGGPWDSSNLFEFTHTQSGDVMVVTHRDFIPQVIERTSATTFTIADIAFREAINGDKVYQPYFKFAADNVTLSCSATTGSITVTANAGIFISDYVGQRLRWSGVELEVTSFVSTTQLTCTVRGTLQVELLENPYRTQSGSTTVQVSHVAHGLTNGVTVTLAGSSDTGGITAANLNGARVITVIDDNTYSIVAGGAATESVDGGGPAVTVTGANLATRNWDEQVFSVINGYPGACLFHEGRLWLAGSGGIPDGAWSSKVFDFFNFDVGDSLPSDSIQFQLGSDDISNIRHLVSNGDLQLFTATGDFYLEVPRGQALEPLNVIARKQTPYGASFIRPEVFDGATIYAQASNTGLREYLYNEATQRYASTDLNLLTSHLIQEPVDMDAQYGTDRRPEQYAYVVNTDGTLPVFYSSRAEDLAGWSLWSLGGAGDPEFSSVCVLGNIVWFSVLRNGSYRLQQLSLDTTNSIDGMTNYTSGSAKTAWAVGSQYYNQTVSVRSGTYYLGEYEVDGSGNLTLDIAVDTIDVGYDFTFELESLPVNVQLQSGPYTGLPKRINRVQVGLDEAYSLAVNGQELVLRNTSDDLSLPPNPITGTRQFFLRGYDRDAKVTITQPEPQPAKVLGMSMECNF